MEKILIYTDIKKMAQIRADINEILNRANNEIIPRLRNINVEPTDCVVHWILQRHTDAVQHWVGIAKRPKIKGKLSRKFYEHMVKDDEAELFDYIEQQPAPTEEQKQYIGAIVYDKAKGRAVISAEDMTAFYEPSRVYLNTEAQAAKFRLQEQICELLADFFGTERGGRIPNNWDKCFLNEEGNAFVPRLLKNYDTLK